MNFQNKSRQDIVNFLEKHRVEVSDMTLKLCVNKDFFDPIEFETLFSQFSAIRILLESSLRNYLNIETPVEPQSKIFSSVFPFKPKVFSRSSVAP